MRNRECKTGAVRQHAHSAFYTLHFTLILALVFITGGASCNRPWIRQIAGPPRTLPESATLEQIVAKVNENTAKVHSLQSTQASLHIPGVPGLRSQVAMQPARRFRLLADGPLGGGSELDLGSNDELFWLWIRRNEPPAIFFCAHDQFATSNARQLMPVEPEWLLEAVGLAYLDPSQPMEGPTNVGGGRLMIKSRRPTSTGELVKTTVVDEWDGTVLEQHLYDAGGQRIASALTSRYKADPQTGVALPRTIEVQWPTADMSFRLEVTDWLVNAPPMESLWVKPEPPGYPNVNLADPSVRFMVPGTAAATLPAPALPPIAAPGNMPNNLSTYPHGLSP